MPRRWDGKWFKKNSGKKPSRSNGRGQPKRGAPAPSGQFPVVTVVFEKAGPKPAPPRTKAAPTAAKSVRTASALPSGASVVNTRVRVEDPKPQPGKRERRHRRRHGY